MAANAQRGAVGKAVVVDEFDADGDPVAAVGRLVQQVNALRRAGEDAPFHMSAENLAALGQLQREIGRMRVAWAPADIIPEIAREEIEGDMADAEAAVRANKRLEEEEEDRVERSARDSKESGKKGMISVDDVNAGADQNWGASVKRVRIQHAQFIPDRVLGRDSRYLPKVEVVVGVTSARGHFDERQALRETWVGHIKGSPGLKSRVVVKFLVGDKGCTIDAKDRADKYGCEFSVVGKPVVDKEVVAYRVPSDTVGAHRFYGPLGMDFETHHPIIITKLGAFDSGSDGIKRNITVRLYSTDTKQLAATMVFTPRDQGVLVGGTRFKPLRPQIALPKGFRGSIVAEGYGRDEPANNVATEHGDTNDGGGLISFKPVSRFGVQRGKFPDSEERHKHESNQYAAGNFAYKLNPEGKAGVEESIRDSSGRDRRSDIQRKRVQEENQLLREEQNIHNDLLMLDHVDTYRTIPSKMILFHKWIAENFQTEFVLKIDDDCFLDIDGVLRGIDAHGLRGRPRVWWSRFRNDWLVERWGKWREPDYAAPVYPSFACGGGNLMSYDLSAWVARNADSLKTYQGEDTSMGIWLAALSPTLIRDYAWHVLEHCSPGLYSMPELSGDKIISMWKNLTSCGNACNCERALAPPNPVRVAEVVSNGEVVARNDGADVPPGEVVPARDRDVNDDGAGVDDDRNERKQDGKSEENLQEVLREQQPPPPPPQQQQQQQQQQGQQEQQQQGQQEQQQQGQQEQQQQGQQ
eukprot:Opistho-2@39853